MLASTNSATLIGIGAVPVTVETNDGERGDPRLVLVGLPDSAVRESIDRVQSGITSSGFSLPRTHTTINLAPGDLRKEGTLFDLPIALSLLASTKQLKGDLLQKFLIAGELGLSGKVRDIKGGISMAMLAKEMKLQGVILPRGSAKDASLVDGIEVYGVGSLAEAIILVDNSDFSKYRIGRTLFSNADTSTLEDFAEVKGQQNLKRAVEVAVSGGHNILIVGLQVRGNLWLQKEYRRFCLHHQFLSFWKLCKFTQLQVQTSMSMSHLLFVRFGLLTIQLVMSD
jgi:magnesium chelatase family protein